jgi:hypothetical protein
MKGDVMAVSSDHVVGFAVGIGATAVGLYAYKKNQGKVDAWLREQGINVPAAASGDAAAMNLEELVTEKERLEDLIAERELAAKEPASKESTGAAPAGVPAKA